MVPGPAMSANTLTNENAPLIIPNPSPETEKQNFSRVTTVRNHITIVQ